MTTLTDKEYDEIFSSAINRVLTGNIPSPIMECNTGNSNDEVEIEVKLHYVKHVNYKLYIFRCDPYHYILNSSYISYCKYNRYV